jgi:hypothetical protein
MTFNVAFCVPVLFELVAETVKVDVPTSFGTGIPLSTPVFGYQLNGHTVERCSLAVSHSMQRGRDGFQG